MWAASTVLPCKLNQTYTHFTIYIHSGATLAVLLYYARMRQLLSFRRFLFLPETILVCLWMILIVLIPQVSPWSTGMG